MLLPVAPHDAIYRILILTSDDHLGRALYAANEKAGFEVRRVTEAIMGLAIWEGFNPHLVLVDARPGVFEGFTVCRQARAQDYLTPIILLGAADEADEIAALKSGADDYVGELERVPVILARVVAQLRRAFKYNVPPTKASTTADADKDSELLPFWDEEEETEDNPESDPQAEPEEFSALDDFFFGEETDSPPKPNVLPTGWTECELCGYRAPREQFEKEDILGRIKLVCPNCKESEHVVYSLN